MNVRGLLRQLSIADELCIISLLGDFISQVPLDGARIHGSALRAPRLDQIRWSLAFHMLNASANYIYPEARLPL